MQLVRSVVEQWFASSMINCLFSDDVKKSFMEELNRYLYLETGGVLLGYCSEDCIYVKESIGGGKKAIREPAFFQFDYAYVEKACANICAKYNPPLTLVGVWHKHNHDLDPAFSKADYDMHKKLSDQYKDVISVLFQKGHNNEYKVQILDSNMTIRRIDIIDDL